MAIKVITKKRFENKVMKLLDYLNSEWNDSVAINFKKILLDKLNLLSNNPKLGTEVNSIKNIRSILITKHNRVYYKIEGNKIAVINMIDTRMNPKKNPFNKLK